MFPFVGLAKCLFSKKSSCQDASDSEARPNRSCGPFDILIEINQIYEKRLKTCDRDNPKDWKLKACVLTKWVSDLLQQNCLMVSIIEILEEEAIKRISLKTQCVCADASTFTECCEPTIKDVEECDDQKYAKYFCKKCMSKPCKELEAIKKCLDHKLCEKQQELCMMKQKIETLSKKYTSCKFETQLKTDIINKMRKDVKRKFSQQNTTCNNFLTRRDSSY